MVFLGKQKVESILTQIMMLDRSIRNKIPMGNRLKDRIEKISNRERRGKKICLNHFFSKNPEQHFGL